MVKRNSLSRNMLEMSSLFGFSIMRWWYNTKELIISMEMFDFSASHSICATLGAITEEKNIFEEMFLILIASRFYPKRGV